MLSQKHGADAVLMASVRRNATRRRREKNKQGNSQLLDNIIGRASWQAEFFEVQPMLRILPDQEREVIELRYLSALSVKEEFRFAPASRKNGSIRSRNRQTAHTSRVEAMYSCDTASAMA